MDRFQSPELCYKGLWLYGLVAADAEFERNELPNFRHYAGALSPWHSGGALGFNTDRKGINSPREWDKELQPILTSGRHLQCIGHREL